MLNLRYRFWGFRLSELYYHRPQPAPPPLVGARAEDQQYSLHRSLYRETVETSVQYLNPNSCNSFSPVLRYVSFSLPLFLLPWGAQVRAMRGIPSFSVHNTWPIHPIVSFSVEGSDELRFSFLVTFLVSCHFRRPIHLEDSLKALMFGRC